jgi:hypothetical protein
MGGEQAVGYGTALLEEDAIKKARGEAWERLYLQRLARERTNILSSNGFAAGKTLNQAQSAARLELIERAVLLEAWRSQSGWKEAKLSFSAHLLAACFNALGWKVRVFELLHQGEFRVHAGLAEHPIYGATFDTSATLGRDSGTDKVLKSLLRQISLTQFQSERKMTRETLPAHGKPQDHALFYSNPANRIAFSFLESDGAKIPLPFTGIDLIQIEQLPTPPGAPFVARATHPDWPALT